MTNNLAVRRLSGRAPTVLAQDLGIRLEGQRVDVLKDMADELELSRGPGSRSEGNFSIVAAKPRGDLQAEEWTQFD
jgi:hypothetical protein